MRTGLPGKLFLAAILSAGVAGHLGSALAVQQATPAPDPELVEAGRAVYVEDCEPCHGSTGEGDGPAARFLDVQPRDLTAGEWEYATDGTLEEIERVVGEGVEGTEMEPFSEILSEEEIHAVAVYVFNEIVQPSRDGE